MADAPGQTGSINVYSGTGAPLPERLERGEVIYFPVCPFPLPEGDDRLFLLEQELGGGPHKNISYDPLTGKTGGFRRRSAAQAQRLRNVLAAFSRAATTWAAATLPDYARGWRLDRASFRPVEEATRRLRQTARNDLVHVDSFPSRPTMGYRILRFFTNVNPDEPRVWVTSEPLPTLFERFAHEVGLLRGPASGWLERLQSGLGRIFRRRRSVYDGFMLRFHNFLKKNEDFQERCPKRFWHFPPGSAWMAMTDMVSHAALRGRYALEHSYFIAPQSLVFPSLAPASLLERAWSIPSRDRAA